MEYFEFEEDLEEYDNEICCRNCVYFVYDSYHDEHDCRNPDSGVTLTHHESQCDLFFPNKHNLKSNKFKVKVTINLEIEDEIEAETEEKALSFFKRRIRNYNFLKGCKEEVIKIREGDKNYPYMSW